jgi:hypothetical protein
MCRQSSRARIVRMLHFRGLKALASHQRRAQGGLQDQLLQGARRGIWQGVEELQPLGELTDRFNIGRALDASLPCPPPVTNGWPTEARLRTVMREPFGLYLGGLGKPLGSYLRGPLVVLLPGPLQQRLVGRLLHERMLNSLDDLGGQAPSVEQFSLHSLRQPVLPRGFVQR